METQNIKDQPLSEHPYERKSNAVSKVLAGLLGIGIGGVILGAIGFAWMESKRRHRRGRAYGRAYYEGGGAPYKTSYKGPSKTIEKRENVSGRTAKRGFSAKIKEKLGIPQEESIFKKPGEY